MTISELICRLQAIKCEHGDLEVFYEDCGYLPVEKIETEILTDFQREHLAVCLSIHSNRT